MNFITILIPTFNRPRYLKFALESVLAQTYKNFEIVISDNSPNDDTENMLQSFNDPRIKYFHDPNGTADSNWDFLRGWDNMNAEWVHWLMDDDAWKPNHLERLLTIYLKSPDVSLVSSGSEQIDADGNQTQIVRPVGEVAIKSSGQKIGKILLTQAGNFIGMPSNILIRKHFLRFGDNACWSEEDSGFFPLIDMSTWFQLLSRGNYVYIPEILTYQREHSKKASYFDGMQLEWAIDFYIFIRRAWVQKNFLTTREEVKSALAGMFFYHARKNLKIARERRIRNSRVEILEQMTRAAQSFIDGAEELPKFKN